MQFGRNCIHVVDKQQLLTFEFHVKKNTTLYFVKGVRKEKTLSK